MSDQTMRLRARIPAPLPAVHHALTDAGALRAWFAEHADVDLAAGRYTFGGRYTPGGEATQKLLHADDHTVRFAWTVDGIEATTEWSLAPESDTVTEVTLTQTDTPTVDEMLKGGNDRSLLQVFWSLAIANLADHVQGRPLTALVDLTSPTMREEIVIDGPKSAVWTAMTDSRIFERWFGARCDMEPWEGGRFSMGGFELDPKGARIFDVTDGTGLSIDFGGMVTKWELAESGGRTTMTVVQSGFDAAQPPYDSWLGWLSGFAELRRFVEGGDAWRQTWLSIEVPGMPPGMLTI